MTARGQLRRRRLGTRWVAAVGCCGAVAWLASGSVAPVRSAGATLGVTSFGCGNSTAGTSCTASGGPTGAGDLLVVAIRDRATSGAAMVTGVSDGSNTWTPIPPASITYGQADAELWYVADAASVSSVTVTVSASAAIAVTVLDVTGVSSATLDATGSSSGNSTAPSVATTAPTAVDSEIAIADIGWNNTPTISGQSAGYSQPATPPPNGAELSTVSGEKMGEQAAWQVLSSTGTQTYSATLSGAYVWTTGMATFEFATSSPSPSTSPSPSPSATPTPPAGPPHIMLIVEENQEYDNIIGNTTYAPYLNSLASQYASATNWYSVEHNSPTDYLDLISGSDQGLGRTTYNHPPFSATTLVDELYNGGTNSLPWKAYFESMPAKCSTTSSYDLDQYDRSHNPFWYFSSYKSYCNHLGTEGVVPYPGSSGLVSALDGSGAPDFVFLIPNDCDEMHGDTTDSSAPCYAASTDTNKTAGNNALIAMGDTWLQNNLPPILASSWFKDNGVVILTWDEGTSQAGLPGGTPPDDMSCTSPCGGHIPTLVIGSNNSGSGSFTGGGDEYGILRAIEEAYGVSLLGHSSGTSDGDLSPAFTVSTTGSINGQVTDQTDPSHPGLAGAGVTCTCGGTLTTTTDSGGNYTFSNVTPGSGYGLSFSDPGYVSGSISSVTVSAGGATTENEALAETGGVVSGTVTDGTVPNTPPVSGASVTCNCTGAPTTTTNASGDYQFDDVTPGSGDTVTVAATGYSPVTTPHAFAVMAGAVTSGIDVSLTETGGVVYGQVTNSNGGAPIAGATVTCTCGGTLVATTDSKGDYQFTEVPPAGGYTLAVSAPGYTSIAGVGVPTVVAGTAYNVDVALTAQPVTLGVAESFGAGNAAAGTSLSASPATTTGANDLLVVTVRDRETGGTPATVTSITDSANHTWTRVPAAAVIDGQADEEIWYAVANGSSISTSGSVTVTVSASAAIAFTVLDVTGASSTPLDATGSSSGNSTAPSVATTAPTLVGNEIAIADIGWNGTPTISGQSAGYTPTPADPGQLSTVSGDKTGEQAAWQVLSSVGTQTYSATLSSAVVWTAAIATFEAS